MKTFQGYGPRPMSSRRIIEESLSAFKRWLSPPVEGKIIRLRKSSGVSGDDIDRKIDRLLGFSYLALLYCT